jgi:hypothetical protein
VLAVAVVMGRLQVVVGGGVVMMLNGRVLLGHVANPPPGELGGNTIGLKTVWPASTSMRAG